MTRYHFKCVDLDERDAEDIREFSLSMRRESMLKFLYHLSIQTYLSVPRVARRQAYEQSVSIMLHLLTPFFLRAVGCLWPLFSVPVMYFTQYHVVTTCEVSRVHVHPIVEQLSTSRRRHRRRHYRLAVTRVSLRPSKTYRLASLARERSGLTPGRCSVCAVLVTLAAAYSLVSYGREK